MNVKTHHQSVKRVRERELPVCAASL